MKIGAARIDINALPLHGGPVNSSGYARINGYHIDFWSFQFLFWTVQIVRPRESDTQHPECHAGYRVDDREARHYGWPELPSYDRYY